MVATLKPHALPRTEDLQETLKTMWPTGSVTELAKIV